MYQLTERHRYKTYAYENLKKSQPFAKGHEMKYAVIAPSMLYLLYPLQGEIEGYSKDKFVEDLVNEVSDQDVRSNIYSHDSMADNAIDASVKRTSVEHSKPAPKE